MAQLPTYAEVLRKDPERLDYSGKVRYLPHWPRIHPDYKPEHLNKPEHQWIFGHPVMILSREPSEKGNIDVCVLRTFQGRGLEAEHGASLQSRFYLPIHAVLPYPLTGHPFTGHPLIPVLYLINPQYRVLQNCWVNLKKTYTVPYHCLDDFIWSDNTTIPTLTRTSYWQMVVYQRDVVPGLLREEGEMEATEMEEVAMEQADTERADADTDQAEMDDVVISILVGSETSSTGISSGTVSSGGSTSVGSSSEGSRSQGSSSLGSSSQGSSSEGSPLEGSSVEGSSCDGSSCDGPPPDTPPPDGSSSECQTSDGPPS